MLQGDEYQDTHSIELVGKGAVLVGQDLLGFPHDLPGLLLLGAMGFTDRDVHAFAATIVWRGGRLHLRVACHGLRFGLGSGQGKRMLPAPVERCWWKGWGGVWVGGCTVLLCPCVLVNRHVSSSSLGWRAGHFDPPVAYACACAGAGPFFGLEPHTIPKRHRVQSVRTKNRPRGWSW